VIRYIDATRVDDRHTPIVQIACEFVFKILIDFWISCGNNDNDTVTLRTRRLADEHCNGPQKEA
jgi:hypothetical protein